MMWWTNWTIPHEYTPAEARDTSDVRDHAVSLFKDRGLMYPCMEMIDASALYIKLSIFDIRSLPSWHKSRVCLIGDAAHAVILPSHSLTNERKVSPNSGQGASLALEDASLLALLLTRSESSPQEVFPLFEKSRRKRVEMIVEEGRRQKSNKTQVSTVGMWIRNTFISVLFHIMSADRLVGKAWRYRIDWDETNIDKIVKWWRNGKLVHS
jgi:2-polyprenyl-6-methoxyphenol hydroxylase-like FAD-dependent oxidoreductase